MSAATAPPATSPRSRRSARRAGRVLRRYRDGEGAIRELAVRTGADGSVLLVDRNPARTGKERLVAHLAADEPRANALLAARLYLDADPESRRCRALEDGDEQRPPFAPPREPPLQADSPASPDGAGRFRLRRVPAGMSIPSLRWTRTAVDGHTVAVSLREAIGETESYEPFCQLTHAALARHEDDPAVSSTVLRAEISRVVGSPIVLNRGLREAVVASVTRGEATMSEIAMRCGRMSWVARRVGLVPEGGAAAPTRWVHTDVLALIARRGLGIAPREVELG